MEFRHVKNRQHRLAIAVFATSAGLALAPKSAAQELAGAEERFEVESGPGALPGRDKGDRTKPPSKAPTLEPSEMPPPAADAREWFNHKPWRQWARITGDWGGARTKFEDSGVTINGSYTLDWSSVVSGGLHEIASSRHLFDLNVAFDLDVIWGLEGGTIFTDMYASDVRGGSEDSGDFTGVSNIHTGQNIQQIAELWYEQWMFDKKLRLKAGKVDANAEFAFFKFATPDFLNGASANPTPLYQVFPTYPNPATAINLFFYPSDNWYIGAALYDGSVAEGNPTGRLGPASFFEGDAYFWIGETGVSWGDEKTKRGRVLGGVWHSTATFANFDDSDTDGQTGFYVMAEQQLRRRGETEELRDKGLYVFGEYGYGDEDVNPVSNHIGVGLSTFGTFANRHSDTAGVMFNWLGMSDADGAGFSEDELSFEAYYKWQITPAVSLTPDLQYIVNPSGSQDTDDALAGR